MNSPIPSHFETRLAPSETELVGKWEWKDNRMIGDATEKRISWLVINALEMLASTDEGWTILYKDPADGRYWELTFPKGEMQGGGPQRLLLLTHQAAAEKYSLTL